MSDPTDQELFDNAVSNEPAQDIAQEVAAPEPVEEQQPVARDENGRFAAKEAVEQPEHPEQHAGERKEPPEFRFREVSEAKRQAEEKAVTLEAQNRALMQMLQQFQPQGTKPEAMPADVPDFWADPDGWHDSRVKTTIDPMMQQMRGVLMHNARLVASSIHGADKIAAAEQAFNQAQQARTLDPVEYNRIQNDPNPFDAAVRWHERQALLSEIGTDPKAYEQKIIERYLASQGQQTGRPAQAGPGGTVVSLPQSLNRVTSAASSNAGGAGDDVSDAALFQQTTARRR